MMLGHCTCAQTNTCVKRSFCNTGMAGPVQNPIHAGKSAGGSSGGSAAAVAAGLCQFALGSDTGGSVRVPAGYCNISGFKPAYGAVSRAGLTAHASSFDTVGILAHNVEDIELIYREFEPGRREMNRMQTSKRLANLQSSRRLETIRGADHLDAFTQIKPLKVRKGRVVPGTGIPTSSEYNVILDKSAAVKGLHWSARAAWHAGIRHLRHYGVNFTSMRNNLLPYALSTYYILTTGEASSNLARFGIPQNGKCVTLSFCESPER